MTTAGNAEPDHPPVTPLDREWLRRAVALWIVFAVVASVKVCVQPTQHTVYPVFARGAQSWWSDVSLYLTYADSDLFRYTPTFAVAMTPFGLLPERVGGILWLWTSVLGLLGAMHLFVRHVLPGRWPPQREALLLALTLVGALRGVWSGQNNALLIAAAMLGMVAVARRRWWAAAFLLCAPVFIKIWPLALVLLVCACWPRQMIGRAVVACAVLAAIPFLTRPPEIVVWQYGQFAAMLNATQIERWAGYRDLWTIWEHFQFPVDRNLYEIVQCDTALVVLGWCLWQRHRLSCPRRVLTSIFAVWLGWQLVFGPGSERLTYMIIAPMTTWALLASFEDRRHRALAVAAWTLTSLLSMGAFERMLAKTTPLAPAVLPAGVLVFLLWLALHETARGTEVAEFAEADPHGVAILAPGRQGGSPSDGEEPRHTAKRRAS